MKNEKTKEELMQDRIDKKIKEVQVEQQKDYGELNALARNTKKGLVIGCLTFSVSKLGGSDFKLRDVTRVPSEGEIKSQLEKIDAADIALKKKEKENLDKEVKKETDAK